MVHLSELVADGREPSALIVLARPARDRVMKRMFISNCMALLEHSPLIRMAAQIARMRCSVINLKGENDGTTGPID